MNETILKQTVQHAVKHSSLPAVVREVVDLINNPKTNVARLSAALAKDQRLVHSVIRKANSSLYGYSSRVNNLNFAIVLLGFDVLKETVTHVLISRALHKMVDTLFRYQEFWNHSVGCAITARGLAEKSQRCNPDDAFVAGLLHDAGFIILQQSPTDSLEWSTERRVREETARMMIEPPLGITHTEAGSWMAEHWKLPEDIIEAIRLHHTPWLATKNPALTAAVHIAEVLCHRTKIGAFPYESAATFDTDALQTLALSASDLTVEQVADQSAFVNANLPALPTFDMVVSALKNQLIEAIGALPEQERLIIALRYYEGLSFKEIGQVLEMDESDACEFHAESLSTLKSVIQNCAARKA